MIGQDQSILIQLLDGIEEISQCMRIINVRNTYSGLVIYLRQSTPPQPLPAFTQINEKMR